MDYEYQVTEAVRVDVGTLEYEVPRGMQAYRQSFDSADYTIRKYKINANETIYGT